MEEEKALQSRQQKGGIARRDRLSAEQRSEIAARAAQARWRAEASGVDLSKIPEFQMSNDVIDAADILLTELSEQAATFSQSGTTALSNGYLAEAKIFIRAIEQTQTIRTAVEKIKTDIIALRDTLAGATHTNEEISIDLASAAVETTGRPQERTDSALMNARRQAIVRTLEKVHGLRLSRRSGVIYRSDSNEIGVVCVISKWHANAENYWYAYHTHQNEFLETTQKGFFVLGMMDLDVAVQIPFEVVRENLSKLNTTTPPDRQTWWHFHVSRSGSGGLSLQRAKGEPPLPLDRYIVKITG